MPIEYVKHKPKITSGLDDALLFLPRLGIKAFFPYTRPNGVRLSGFVVQPFVEFGEGALVGAHKVLFKPERNRDVRRNTREHVGDFVFAPTRGLVSSLAWTANKVDSWSGYNDFKAKGFSQQDAFKFVPEDTPENVDETEVVNEAVVALDEAKAKLDAAKEVKSELTVRADAMRNKGIVFNRASKLATLESSLGQTTNDILNLQTSYYALLQENKRVLAAEQNAFIEPVSTSSDLDEQENVNLPAAESVSNEHDTPSIEGYLQGRHALEATVIELEKVTKQISKEQETFDKLGFLHSEKVRDFYDLRERRNALKDKNHIILQSITNLKSEAGRIQHKKRGSGSRLEKLNSLVTSLQEEGEQQKEILQSLAKEIGFQNLPHDNIIEMLSTKLKNMQDVRGALVEQGDNLQAQYQDTKNLAEEAEDVHINAENEFVSYRDGYKREQRIKTKRQQGLTYIHSIREDLRETYMLARKNSRVADYKLELLEEQIGSVALDLEYMEEDLGLLVNKIDQHKEALKNQAELNSTPPSAVKQAAPAQGKPVLAVDLDLGGASTPVVENGSLESFANNAASLEDAQAQAHQSLADTNAMLYTLENLPVPEEEQRTDSSVEADSNPMTVIDLNDPVVQLTSVLSLKERSLDDFTVAHQELYKNNKPALIAFDKLNRDPEYAKSLTDPEKASINTKGVELNRQMRPLINAASSVFDEIVGIKAELAELSQVSEPAAGHEIKTTKVVGMPSVASNDTGSRVLDTMSDFQQASDAAIDAAIAAKEAQLAALQRQEKMLMLDGLNGQIQRAEENIMFAGGNPVGHFADVANDTVETLADNVKMNGMNKAAVGGSVRKAGRTVHQKPDVA